MSVIVREIRPAPLRIGYEEHRLPNGLRLVVHEDRSAPIVAVHLMYHAGSKDERAGRTGLAHLLEHLLFEGSLNCPKGEFDRLLERVGGSNNGSTWLDRTNYYETVPTHGLELAMWLERDRMAGFLPVLDAEMLEVQRGVVINERRQSYENRPYGMADERLHQLLFPAEHPYSWPTIGYLPDLEAITLADARAFFAEYYTPRNATLVLAGDVSAAEGLALAERYFGDLPPGPERPRGAAEPPAPRGGAREEMTDRVSFPRLYRAFAVAPYGTPDWVALEVLSYVISDGESSRLQRALVRDGQLAQEVEAYLYPTELAGVFGVVATARSGVGPDELEDAVAEVLADVVESGVEEWEVTGAARRARRDQIASLATVEERAEELAYATTVLGSPAALERVLGSFDVVGPDAVRAAARRYLHAGAGATLVVVPEEGGDDVEA
jgi:zinc protease